MLSVFDLARKSLTRGAARAAAVAVTVLGLAACVPAEGPGAQVVAGWSVRPDNPDWAGGMASGIIAPDSVHLIRLIAAPPVAGLDAVQPPSPEDIPNNHWAYAVQWFLFAGIAAVIYAMAVARRARTRPD